MKITILAVLLPILLLGCESEKAEITQTVEWYTSHDLERKEMREKCMNNPGELQQTPNCINSQIAARIKSATSTKQFRF